MNIWQSIKDATNKQVSVELTVYDTELLLEPYLCGRDALQREYVWGYLRWSCVFYKIFIDDIKNISVSNTRFDTLEWAVYYYFDENEQTAICPDFEVLGNLWAQSHLYELHHGRTA